MPDVRMPDGVVVRFPDTMSPDEIRSLIATKFPDAVPQPDKYQQQAMKDIEAAKAAGYGEDGLGRRFLQGATFGAADEILAGFQAPVEMIRQGTFSPIEGYNFAKAREDALLAEARDRQGALGTAAEIMGGVVTGTGAAKAGATFMPQTVAPSVGARLGGAAADGAVFGALSGFNEGSGLEERLQGAAIGGAAGGALGAAIPALGAVFSGPLSAIRAMVNPSGVADAQMARAIAESGRSADDVARAVAQAANEGQGVYTVADELGNAGQRMLGTVTRAPGPGRQVAVDFLDERQAGQAGRVGDFIEQGLDARSTAAALRTAQEAARRAEGNALYGAARDSAGAVDLSAPLGMMDDILRPGVNKVVSPGSNIADDSVEGAVRRAQRFLTDGRSVLSDFDSVLRAKQEIDSIIDRATPTQQRVLIPIRNAIDESLERASPDYAAARNAYRSASRGIEAIDTGRDMALRGRAEDNIPTFRGMAENERAGVRAGYADRLVERVDAAPQGTNVVRPLTSEKYRAELPELAGAERAPLLQRRLDRESTMFRTRGEATSGSKTADNLADMEGMRVDPSIFGNLASGNVVGALSSGARQFITNLSGYTPAVREELGQLLLMRGAQPRVVEALQRAMDRSLQTRQMVARYLGGLMGGTAVAPNALPGNGSQSPR